MGVSPRAISAAMEYVAAMTIEQIAQDEAIDETTAAELFLSSKTAETLFDDSRKLWWDGPSAVADLYYEEMGRGDSDRS